MPLSDIIGHDRAMRVLTGMINKGTVASACLFSGPAGVGKRFAALEFAAALNCQEAGTPGSAGGCGQCTSCRKTRELIHPDVKIIIAEGAQIVIEKIRELEEFLSITPTEGRYKAVLVEDADKLNVSSANAFLKTLEEPPPDSVILLMTAKEESLPETIRSRCARIHFSPLSLKSARALAQRKGISLDDSQLGLRLSLAGEGTGGMFAADMLELRNQALQLFVRVLDGTAEKGRRDREELRQWLDAVLTFLRDLAVVKSAGAQHLLINRDKVEELAALGKAVDLQTVVSCWEKTRQARGELMLNINPSLLFNCLGSELSSAFERNRPQAGAPAL